MSACQVCGGDPVLLGSLGNHEWSRCRACGSEFSSVKDNDEFGDGDIDDHIGDTDDYDDRFDDDFDPDDDGDSDDDEDGE